MPFACWMRKTKITLSEYVILAACRLQKYLQERSSRLFMYIVCFLSRQIQEQHLDVSEAKIPAFQNLNYSLFYVLSQNWDQRLLYALRISLRLFICPSVRPSVRMKQLGYYWMDFHEISYLGIFPKSVEQFKFLWNLTRITSTLLEDQ